MRGRGPNFLAPVILPIKSPEAACRTKNPEEADFFFVPSYSTCLWVKEGVENDTAAEQKIFGPIMELLASSPWSG